MRQAGRLTDYRGATLYTTLAPATCAPGRSCSSASRAWSWARP
ncbi:hypothetical protein [Arthrobacter sp.]